MTFISVPSSVHFILYLSPSMLKTHLSLALSSMDTPPSHTSVTSLSMPYISAVVALYTPRLGSKASFTAPVQPLISSTMSSMNTSTAPPIIKGVLLLPDFALGALGALGALLAFAPGV